MRNNPLDALLSKTRQGLLAKLLFDPEREWYLSDLARNLQVQPSSLQRELAALVEAEILLARKDGNRTYYRANQNCPFYGDLRGLLLKTLGLGDVLRKSLEGLSDRIDVAFVYGSFARSTGVTASSDIDVMVIGRAGLAELAPALKRVEQELGRPVNPSTYTAEEIAKKLATGHHFVRTVMDGEKLFIRGDEGDLAAALNAKPNPTAHDEQE
jgi:predicted nucleotidyltransferase